MSNIIDAKGRSCPEPVLMVQQAAKAGGDFVIEVDNSVAVQNITRFCSNNKLNVTSTKKDEYYILSISKG